LPVGKATAAKSYPTTGSGTTARRKASTTDAAPPSRVGFFFSNKAPRLPDRLPQHDPSFCSFHMQVLLQRGSRTGRTGRSASRNLAEKSQRALTALVALVGRVHRAVEKTSTSLPTPKDIQGSSWPGVHQRALRILGCSRGRLRPGVHSEDTPLGPRCAVCCPCVSAPAHPPASRTLSYANTVAERLLPVAAAPLVDDPCCSWRRIRDRNVRWWHTPDTSRVCHATRNRSPLGLCSVKRWSRLFYHE
jgi:hypothetical protein